MLLRKGTESVRIIVSRRSVGSLVYLFSALVLQASLLLFFLCRCEVFIEDGDIRLVHETPAIMSGDGIIENNNLD